MAIPKLCLIPATQGTKLYSVLPSNGVGDFAFTRGSSATRINSQGLIETVASGVSRLNYPLIDGVVNGCPSHLLEPIRTNFQKQSEYASGWTAEGAALTNNEEISPSGELNASKITAIATNASHKGYPPFASGLVNGGLYSATVFMKSDGYDFGYIRDGYSGRYVIFDLVNGIVSSQSSATGNISYFGNGWYRCFASMNTVATNFRMDTGILETSSQNPSTSWLGNGTSGIYIYGAQLEEGSYSTSYIPTTTAAVTRSAETANGAGDASTFNDSEGVLMAEISALANDLTYRGISLGDGTASNVLRFYYENISNRLTANIKSSGTTIATLIYNFSDITISSKIALKYKQNDFALWVNGSKVDSFNSGVTPLNMNKLQFDTGTGGDDFYGNTKQIQYYDSALNDSDLETLTSWTSFTDLANGQTYSIK